ncbi:MAG TPA: hypothetical protein VMM13_07875, partial [Euzebya sp.]|nr:hypothetical protein [Euzebya sp.]
AEAVAVTTAPGPRAILLLRRATLVAFDLETLDPLTPLVEEATALATTLDDAPALLAKLQLLWAVTLNEIAGDAPAARIALAEADRQAAASGDPVLRAFVTLRLGYQALDVCDFAAAEQLMTDAIKTFDDLGHERGAAMALQGLSCTHDERYELAPALAAAEAAARRFGAIGSRGRALMAEEMRGQRLIRLGVFEEAVAVLTDVIEGYRRRGTLSLIPETRVWLASGLAAAGRIREADDTYAEGIGELAATGQPNMLRFVLFPWARFLLDQGRTLEAELAAIDLARLHAATGAEPLVAASEALLGHVVLQAGNPEKAMTHATTAWRAVGGERMAEGLVDPILTMLDCRAVFLATEQPDRAQEALAIAGVHMRRAAGAITDPALRAGYLSRVPECRAVVAAERAGSAA